MIFKKLGRTKTLIPALGIGTWKMGVDKKKEIEAIRTALDYGMLFVDTAEMYGTERLVGEAIKEYKDVFLSTKVSPHHFHYDDVIKSCNSSLEKLGVKTIDLYQLHWPNENIPIKETMRAMEQLVKDGKIRYIGVSNFSISQFKEAQACLKSNEIVSNQVLYNILERESADVEEFCNKENITFIAYSPLARGEIYRSKKVLELLNVIGSKFGKSPTQVVLNWLISKKSVVAIPKAGSREHVIEITESSDFKLSKRDIKELDRINYTSIETMKFSIIRKAVPTFLKFRGKFQEKSDKD